MIQDANIFALPYNQILLTKLYLGERESNRNWGYEHLCSALQSNTTLQELDFRSNKISDLQDVNIFALPYNQILLYNHLIVANEIGWYQE